jgi:hypothetical protein
MKITPFGRMFIGFYNELDVGVLAQLVQPLMSESSIYFSTDEEPKHLHQLFCECHFTVEDARCEPETSGHPGLLELFHKLSSHEWRKIEVQINHRPVTQFRGIPLSNLYKGECFSLAIDQDDNTCEVKCRLQDDTRTLAFLDKLYNELHLSNKPEKYSREIPQWLETQLLCDSMHLCNVCRDEGVILHHIVAVEDGGKTEEENLVVLCLTHHRQVHSKSQLTKNLTAPIYGNTRSGTPSG